MSQPTKMVSDRKKSADSVRAAISTHAELVQRQLSERFGEDVGAAARTLLNGLGRKLAQTTDTMVAADGAHAAELADDAEPRTQRAAAAAAIQDTVTEIRGVCGGLYGPAFLKKLGLEGSTPEDPVRLHSFIDTVITKLKTEKPPKSRVPDVTVDPKRWVPGLQMHRADLGTALETVAKELREAEGALVTKNQCVDAHDECFSVVATLTSALLAAAGEKELAGRVRPSARRAGQTAEAGDTPAPETTPV